MNSMFKILNLSKECEKTISVLFGPILNSGNKSFTSKSIAVGELLKLPAGRCKDLNIKKLQDKCITFH